MIKKKEKVSLTLNDKKKEVHPSFEIQKNVLALGGEKRMALKAQPFSPRGRTHSQNNFFET